MSEQIVLRAITEEELELAAAIKAEAKSRGISVKQAGFDAVKRGLAARPVKDTAMLEPHEVCDVIVERVFNGEIAAAEMELRKERTKTLADAELARALFEAYQRRMNKNTTRFLSWLRRMGA